MPYTNLDTIHRPNASNIAPYQWGDGVNDDLNYLYGDTTWSTATMQNAWVASVAVSYVLLGRVVYIRGVITTGAAGTVAFTLPAGYRPLLSSYFVCPSSTTASMIVLVNSSGQVIPEAATTVNLFPISFPNF